MNRVKFETFSGGSKNGGTDSHELTTVKSVNMGSMFRLTYNLKLKDAGEEKKLLDSIRCRNGNLEIMISNQATEAATSVL